jgi:uncharacterized SAM-binding protein YcdF (DUF218 family)
MAPPPRARSAVRRAALALLVLAVGSAVAFVCFVLYGGRFLQHEDPQQHVDAIFVLAGARVERWLEAVSLYREGIAPVIALSPGLIEPSEAHLRAIGVKFPRDVDLTRDAMEQLGVPASAIVTPDGSVDNTAQEATLLREWARARSWRRVMIVTSKYHTRRAGFAFRRELAGSGIVVLIRSTRYDPSDPAHWYRHRSDARFVLEEWQKLLAYRLGLAR